MARVISVSGQVAAPAPAADAQDLAKEKETFELVCGACHGTDLLEGSLRTPAEVADLLSTMQSYGASATPEQFEIVRTHLLRAYGKANVNSANAADLAPVLDLPLETAEAVVKVRAEQGRFASPDDLKKVPGVDAAKLDARRDRITF
ncbi:MAG: helix-hairpin-helix domain-containing protein [Vicinamibacterales bacterium]